MADEVDKAWQEKRHELGLDCGQVPCAACGASAMQWIESERQKMSAEEVELARSLFERVFDRFGKHDA